MIEHIKKLEKMTNKMRTDYVKQVLGRMDVAYSVQPFRQRVLKGENIIVEQFCGSSSSHLLLTAHTNKYFSSPGANDNASGVAVLLEVVKQLKLLRLKKHPGVKIIFFDLEDGLAMIDGSSYFVHHTDESNISFVLNLDGVGMGDSVTLSPKITNKTINKYIEHLIECLVSMRVRHHSFELPPFMVEDHVPFSRASIPALSLNIMPMQDVAFLERMNETTYLQKLKHVLIYRGLFRRHDPMIIMRHRHNDLDISKYLSERSLQLAFRLSMNMVEYHIKTVIR